MERMAGAGMIRSSAACAGLGIAAAHQQMAGQTGGLQQFGGLGYSAMAAMAIGATAKLTIEESIEEFEEMKEKFDNRGEK